MAMMYCPECGKKINDKAKQCDQCGYKFETQFCTECGIEFSIEETECPNCGCPVINTDKNLFENGEMIKPKTKNIKKSAIIASASVFLIALFFILFYFVQNSNPVKKYCNYVNLGKETEATKLYEEKISDNEEFINELSDIQNAEMDEIYNKYVDKDTTYDESVEELEKFMLYDASKHYANEVKNKVQKLNVSRTAYDDALEAENDDDIEQAIKKYKMVISEDSTYNEAQGKVEELTDQLKNELLTEADNYCSNKQYTEAIQCIDRAISTFGSSDELSSLKEEYTKLKSEQYVKVVVADKTVTNKDSSNWIFYNYVNLVFDITNNSDKGISGIEGILIVNDLFGKEILRCGCDFTGHTIMPGETYRNSDLSYTCNDFITEDMKFFNTAYSDLQFMYDISSIVFDDGTTIKPE